MLLLLAEVCCVLRVAGSVLLIWSPISQRETCVFGMEVPTVARRRNRRVENTAIRVKPVNNALACLP